MSEKEAKAVKLLDTKLDKKVIKTLTVCTVIMLIAILIHDGDHIRQAYNWGYTIPLSLWALNLTVYVLPVVTLFLARSARASATLVGAVAGVFTTASFLIIHLCGSFTGNWGVWNFSYFDLIKGVTYVGVGASRVRDLFDQAKKVAPAIIFIDEIDAVGRQRGSGLGGGHDEREQTLNQLLVEMDGFGNNEGVIVMAATNRADILDNALLRPGRFDRQVYVGMPDIKGREAILKIHARGKPLADDVDLKSIAKGTPGFSGADLENLMNEAALLAVRRKHRFITMEDCDEAILKVEMGPEKKSRKMSDKAKRLTAYHESGHAITSKFLQHTDPVHYITIIPRGMAGGFTLYRPDEDTEDFTSKAQMFERIVSCLGGRIAEKLFLDDISTGASGDIQQATSIARNMVTRYGMSEKLGPIQYDSSDHSIFIGRDFGQTKSYSEETAALIDEEVKRIFDEASVLCEKILTEHRDTLIGVAEYLLENESMDRDTFDYYCEHGTFPEPKPAPAMQDDTIERPARKIARFDDPPTEDASAGMADEPDDGDKH